MKKTFIYLFLFVLAEEPVFAQTPDKLVTLIVNANQGCELFQMGAKIKPNSVRREGKRRSLNWQAGPMHYCSIDFSKAEFFQKFRICALSGMNTLPQLPFQTECEFVPDGNDTVTFSVSSGGEVFPTCKFVCELR